MFSRTLVLTCSSLALVGLGLASSPVVTIAEAQSRAVPRIRFQEMDANNDGRVTRQEWNGSTRSFEVHDWNGDGVLSGEEVRVGGRRVAELESADHQPNRLERNLSWTRTAFTNLDHNRDGRLTSNEWHYDLETFRRVDRNRDNAINVSEFLGEGWDDDRGDNFDDLDFNNNGRVERTEWHGGRNEFNALDRNRDGFLSRFEMVGSQPGMTTWNEFQNLDYDRNGNLSRAEWHWSNASFTQRDTNRDGIISTSEFEAAGGSPAQVGAISGQPGMQTVRVNAQMRWVDTGLIVRTGDVVTFNATGQVQMSDNGADVAQPAGSTSGRRAPDAPISGVLAGALIGKIGDYAPIAIGNQGSVTMPVSGRLYLGVNDDHLPDNRGEFVVQVGLQRR
jgi:Ca2+-binding EF-hand superfamily protein